MRSGEAITSEQLDPDGEFPVYGGNGIRGKSCQWTHHGEFALVGRQGALCGNVHHVRGRFFASEHAVVASLRTKGSARWLAYLLSAMNLGQYSVAAAQPGLAVDRILNLHVPVPPAREQVSLARWLDQECARIEELMGELDAAEHDVQALSRELFDTYTLTVSRKRLRFAVHRIEQGWSPVCDDRDAEPGEWGVLKLGCVNGGQFSDVHKALSEGLVPRPELEVLPGDVLMSRANTRDLVGSCAFVRDIRPNLMLSDLLYRLRIDESHWAPEFVALAVGAPRVRDEIRAVAAGSSSSMPKLNHGLVKNLTIPVASLENQRKLVAQIAEAERVPVALTREYEATRAALVEYRDALITEAVTGKLDVSKMSPTPMADSVAAVLEGEATEVLSL